MSLLKEGYRLNNEVSIPKIALGTWQIPITEAVHAVSFALDHGYTQIDGAHAYTHSAGSG